MKRRRYWYEPLWHQLGYQLAAHLAHDALTDQPERQPQGRRHARASMPTAEQAARTLLYASASVLSGPPQISLRPSAIRAALALRSVLGSTIEPSASLLLADQRLRMQAPDPEERSVLRRDSNGRLSRRRLLQELERERAPGRRVLLASDLAAYVAAKSGVSYRVEYNLACWYATLSRLQPTERELKSQALERLERSFVRMQANLRPGVAAWAAQDPTLIPLRDEPAFTRLINVYAVVPQDLPGSEEPDTPSTREPTEA